MFIVLLCPYPVDTVPGQRLKYEQYLDFLRSEGYQISVHSFFSNDSFAILYQDGKTLQKIFGVIQGFCRRLLLLPQIQKADGIYVFLNIVPVGPAWLEWLFLRFAKKTIYDIDDMVHMIPTTSANIISRPFKTPSRYFMLLRRSDHVITCTPALDRLARLYNPCTTDISSTINTSTYLPVNDYSNDKRLVIGWSGSHSTIPYLHLLDSVFQELSARFNFKLLVLGTSFFRIPGIDVESVPWSVETEIPNLQRIDVGVYPLPDTTWVQGKSGLKALQYMSLGIPTVASNIGCNSRVIENGVSGFLVHNHESWVNRLGQLLQDPELRRKIGTRARERVVRYYSVEANKNTYLSLYRSVYGMPKHLS